MPASGDGSSDQQEGIGSPLLSGSKSSGSAPGREGPALNRPTMLAGGLNRTLKGAPVGHQLRILKGTYGFKTASKVGFCFV